MFDPLLYIHYTDENNIERGKLCYSWQELHETIFCPEIAVHAILKFSIPGKTYQERKEAARNLAIQYQAEDAPGLSYQDRYCIEYYFEKIGRHYGLMHEFKENAIC